MTRHADIPLEVIDTLLLKLVAKDYDQVIGGLQAVRNVLLDPNVASQFEINATILIGHQMNRIIELENAADRFADDIAAGNSEEFLPIFREWLVESNSRYVEQVKEFVKE